MKIGILYHSAGGNTKALAEAIGKQLPMAELLPAAVTNFSSLSSYDGLLIGTYTWGDGELPARMKPLYDYLEVSDISHITTGVFGTGETNYSHFCGAVDLFRNMLFVKSRLAVTLKVEQMYQQADMPRIERFSQIFADKLNSSRLIN
ncbi:flavodoxin domain-containing protein [Bacillus massiliglaciei]|uniref:flavodoxin domain-containing protein n=1 Tax=Bacillus massiliglaciei TaxID=1816693 RepID=UPI000AD0FC4A|nr:flavodoxin domain-containing protein [Bacillus massiliglaciei]